MGPEGGFPGEELEKIHRSGFSSVTLGNKILKTETAALYATCLFDSFLETQNES
ncbi:MAG: RsmE family RNA methyltransferase [bacterium]|nr:RsmE family RNA methyltransferase [bacterium]